ncbi:hypothetical protein D3C76_847260 [compost metagenome]
MSVVGVTFAVHAFVNLDRHVEFLHDLGTAGLHQLHRELAHVVLGYAGRRDAVHDALPAAHAMRALVRLPQTAVVRCVSAARVLLGIVDRRQDLQVDRVAAVFRLLHFGNWNKRCGGAGDRLYVNFLRGRDFDEGGHGGQVNFRSVFAVLNFGHHDKLGGGFGERGQVYRFSIFTRLAIFDFWQLHQCGDRFQVRFDRHRAICQALAQLG